MFRGYSTLRGARFDKRRTSMNARHYLVRGAQNLTVVIAAPIALLAVALTATAQPPTPVLQYGFGANDTLKVIHDLSGNGYDGTVLNPEDAMLGVTDHKGGHKRHPLRPHRNE
jgi:hypothetical protein